MSKSRFTRLTFFLTSVALLLSLAPGIMLNDSARAQSASAPNKVAADLREKVKKSQPADRVSVLIQSNSRWTNNLDAATADSGGSVTRSYSNLDTRAVSLPAGAVETFASRTDIKFVALDAELKAQGHISSTTGANAVRAQQNSAGVKYTLDGTGIGIAILDSGIDPKHISFTNASNTSRIVVSRNFTGENRTDDPYGHGTHVAAAAAGNDRVSQGAYVGTAPNANIINLRVLNSQGRGTVSGLLSALDWLITNRVSYKIRVVNMSLGTTATVSYLDDPLCQAVRKLVNAGVVVVAAAGNEGKNALGAKVYGQIHSPGIEPSAITVGASNTYGSDTRVDDTVTTFSSRGPTRSFRTDSSGVKHYDNLIKPDLVAPGNKILDAQAPGNYFVSTYPYLDGGVSASPSKEQMYLNGTSMSCPIVSGTAALMFQANPNLTPNLIKALMMY